MSSTVQDIRARGDHKASWDKEEVKLVVDTRESVRSFFIGKAGAEGEGAPGGREPYLADRKGRLRILHTAHEGERVPGKICSTG